MNAEFLGGAALLLAAIPAALFVWNLFLVRSPRRPGPVGAHRGLPSLSVLIPARNEEARIGEAIRSVLANQDVDLELIVLDDHSTDGTVQKVRAFAARDARVRLIHAPPLPAGWCGKQHACLVLTRHARHSLLVFMDADVRLRPDALERLASFMDQSGSALASGVPRQVTGSFLERLLIPLVHVVLLGFLPVWRMRRCTKPAYAAGCGQLFVADADAYRQVGGHSQIRSTLHDGIKLPRLFRQHGLRTDLFDATEIASCRMYEGADDVLSGLMKNAHEGLASPRLIVPMSLMLLGGQVLPWILLVGWPALAADTRWMVLAGAVLSMVPRWIAVWRFRQSVLGALLHPISVAVFVGIQWVAFCRRWRGKPNLWRGRQYGTLTDGGTISGHPRSSVVPGGVF
jgi:glycosyltransferase involved in cell wall biosynthesis